MIDRFVDWFGFMWHRAAVFFEKGDLVPFAVIISIWHYYKALEPAGDPLYVAVPVALFIDLLHFRSIRRATENRGLWSSVVALSTTLMALAYHYVFYSMSVEIAWQVWMYAIPIPVGIAILAWYVASEGPDYESLWKESERRVNRLESEVKQRESGMRGAEHDLSMLSEELSLEKEQRKAAELELAATKEELAHAKDEAAQGQRVLSAWEQANKKTKASLRYLAGDFETMKEAGDWAGVSAPTISKQVKSVNGSG